MANQNDTDVSPPGFPRVESLADKILRHLDPPTVAALDGAIEYCLLRAEESRSTFLATGDKHYWRDAAGYLGDAMQLQRAVRKLKSREEGVVTVTNRLGPCAICGEVSEHVIHRDTTGDLPSGRRVHEFQVSGIGVRE